MGRLNGHPWNYLCIFYWYELKLCRMVELCIPKKIVRCSLIFDLNSFWRENDVTRLTVKLKIEVMTKKIK